MSGAEFVAGGGFGDDNTEGSTTPPPVDVPDIPMEEVPRARSHWKVAEMRNWFEVGFRES